MTSPLVSVILPVFNRDAWIARAIDSVLGQTYRNFELLVVDDGSSDGTAAVVNSYGRHLRILKQDNRGVYAARNLGISQAAGELIAFMDSDDRWHPEKLARQLPLFTDPKVGVVFADMRLLEGGPSGSFSGRTAFGEVPPARGDVQRSFVRGNFVPTLTAVTRRICLEQIGGFEGGSRLSADYLAWVRIAGLWKFDYVDASLADYNVHPNSISFDLGRSLSARIDLFGAWLPRAAGDEEQTIRRILFNLGLHTLALVVRGKASSLERPMVQARRAMSWVAPAEAVHLTAAFVYRQVRRRLVKVTR